MTSVPYSQEKAEPRLYALKDLDPRQISYLESLYLRSFPPQERRPWKDIVSPETRPGPELYGIGCGGNICGIITIWRLSLPSEENEYVKAVYVEHFAVDPSLRGGGVGSRVLKVLGKLVSEPIVLEIERDGAPDGMEIRRRRFYERNGFSCLDYDYIQPSYAPGLPEVPLTIMCDSKDIDPAAVDAALRRFVYKAV